MRAIECGLGMESATRLLLSRGTPKKRTDEFPIDVLIGKWKSLKCGTGTTVADDPRSHPLWP